jgi:hypothetical protein
VLRTLRADREATATALQHDRDLAWEERLSADCRVLAERAQRLLDAAGTPTVQRDPGARSTSHRVDGDSWREFERWQFDMLDLSSRVAVRDPKLNRMLIRVAVKTAESGYFAPGPRSSQEDADRFNRLSGPLQTAINVLTDRAVYPELTRSLSPERLADLLDHIDRGAALRFGPSR